MKKLMLRSNNRLSEIRHYYRLVDDWALSHVHILIGVAMAAIGAALAGIETTRAFYLWWGETIQPLALVTARGYGIILAVSGLLVAANDVRASLRLSLFSFPMLFLNVSLVVFVSDTGVVASMFNSFLWINYSILFLGLPSMARAYALVTEKNAELYEQVQQLKFHLSVLDTQETVENTTESESG